MRWNPRDALRGGGRADWVFCEFGAVCCEKAVWGHARNLLPAGALAQWAPIKAPAEGRRLALVGVVFGLPPLDILDLSSPYPLNDCLHAPKIKLGAPSAAGLFRPTGTHHAFFAGDHPPFEASGLHWSAVF